MGRLQALLNEREGTRYYGGALFYMLIGYAGGFAGLFSDRLAINVLAMLLLAHSMTIAAYLVHECGHNLIFRKIQHNTTLGRILIWFCGASYGTYEDIRYKHFRHHIDNDDVVWFDYERFFKEHPLTLKLTRLLEWFYIPAHDLIMHFIMIFTSFIIPQRRDQRSRNVTVILLRASVFVVLLTGFPKVAIFYAIAYMLMMTVLRFMDSLQHDYAYRLNLYTDEESPHKGDLAWEQLHTFSEVISSSWFLPNWLVLNFGFHNAHHSNMSVPWYRLPALHRELTGNDADSVIPLPSQLRLFHRNRVLRVYSEQPPEYPYGADYLQAARAGEGPIGGNAASFITSF